MDFHLKSFLNVRVTYFLLQELQAGSLVIQTCGTSISFNKNYRRVASLNVRGPHFLLQELQVNVVLLGKKLFGKVICNGPICDEVQFSARDVSCEDSLEMAGVLFWKLAGFFPGIR